MHVLYLPDLRFNFTNGKVATVVTHIGKQEHDLHEGLVQLVNYN